LLKNIFNIYLYSKIKYKILKNKYLLTKIQLKNYINNLPAKKKFMIFLDFIILKLTLSIGLVEFKIIFKTIKN
jgi:hypothetical protein